MEQTTAIAWRDSAKLSACCFTCSYDKQEPVTLRAKDRSGMAHAQCWTVDQDIIVSYSQFLKPLIEKTLPTPRRSTASLCPNPIRAPHSRLVGIWSIDNGNSLSRVIR